MPNAETKSKDKIRMDATRSTWILMAVAAAFFAALTAIFAKIGVSGVNSNLATAIRTSVILVLAWGIVLATGEYRAMGEISQRTWIFLVLSALATGASWLFYFAALQRGPASVVAAIDKTSIAMVLVLAALVLGEPFTWKTAIGGLLVVGGALLIAWK
jgi:transporter family protein